jgi:AcrR family transcriptional regulator
LEKGETTVAARPSSRDLEAALSPTETRIVAAARACFESHGIAATRLEDIALGAGLSRQTIYKYFHGKQDIIDQIGFLEMVRINAMLRSALGGAQGFAERLTQAIVLSVEIALNNPYICRAVEELGMLPGFSGADERILDWQRRKWNPMIRRAAARGELAGDLDFEALLQWIIQCQLLLTLSWRRLAAGGIAVPDFVRRFMVAPLLSGPAPSAEHERLRVENATLRALVSDQALELYRLKSGAK